MAGFGSSAPIAPATGGPDPKKPEPTKPVQVGLQVQGAPPAPPPSVGPNAPRFNAANILKSFGQPQAAPAPVTNTSTPNPTINTVNQAQLSAFNGDMNAGALGRASDIAIRDNAENERKAARQNAASRGVSGGGIEDIQQGAITRNTLRDQAGARVGITNDAEARRAALGGQIAGQAAMDENLQNQQRVTAINQQAQAAQQQQNARDSEFNLMKGIIDLFGAEDLFSGPTSGAWQMGGNSGRYN